MPDNYGEILLRVGNEAVLMVTSDPLTVKTVPKNSFKVGFSVEESKLIMSVYLNYSIFYEGLGVAGILADPPMWICTVVFFTALSMLEYGSELPRDNKIYINVNGDKGQRDFKVSCTIETLIDLAYQMKGKSKDDSIPLVMSRVDIED